MRFVCSGISQNNANELELARAKVAAGAALKGTTTTTNNNKQ